jgi:hypothetical protein
MDSKKYWFSAKPFGKGWGWRPPFTWQGWTVLVLFMLSVVVASVFLAPRSQLGLNVFIAAAIVALALVCKWKGEPQKTQAD